MLKPSGFSFGGTATIVTSMGLIAGLHGTTAGKATLISAAY